MQAEALLLVGLAVVHAMLIAALAAGLARGQIAALQRIALGLHALLELFELRLIAGHGFLAIALVFLLDLDLLNLAGGIGAAFEDPGHFAPCCSSTARPRPSRLSRRCARPTRIIRPIRARPKPTTAPPPSHRYQGCKNKAGTHARMQ